MSLASLIVEAPSLHPAAAAWRAARGGLRAALGAARPALGHLLARAARLVDGARLVELSASYLRELSPWAARLVQRWLGELPEVRLLNRQAAVALGARLRLPAPGLRHGLLYSLPEPCARALAALCGVELGRAEDDALVALPARRGPSTFAVRCPRGEAHRNGDSSPSLVLWPLGPTGRGGAACLACGLRGSWAPTADGQTAAVRARGWRAGGLSGPVHNNRNPLSSFGAPSHPEGPPQRSGLSAPSSAVQTTKTTTSARAPDSPLSGVPGCGGGAEPPQAPSPARRWGPLPGGPAPRRADRRGQAQAGPVGGLVAPPLPAGRGAYTVAGTLRRGPHGQAVLGRGHRLQGGPLAALRAADRACAGAGHGAAAQATAQAAAHDAAWCYHRAPVIGPSTPKTENDVLDVLTVPWRLLRTSSAVWRGTVPAGERAGWRDVRQDAVLVDIDAVDLPAAQAVAIARAAVAAACGDPEVAAALAVRTSPRGVQVWCALRAPRLAPARWWALPEVRAWYIALGQRIRGAMRAAGALGGTVDLSAARAGSWGRRPGWRLDRAGRPWCARILADSADSA